MTENEVLQNEYNVHMMHDHPLLQLDHETAFGHLVHVEYQQKIQKTSILTDTM